MLKVKKSNHKLRRIIHLLLFVFLSVSIIIIASLWPKHGTIINKIETTSRINPIHPLNEKVEKVSRKFAMLDNDFRGFMITKDAALFKSYQKGLKDILLDINVLNKYTENEKFLNKIKQNIYYKDSVSNILVKLNSQLDKLMATNTTEDKEIKKSELKPYDINNVLNSIEIDTIKSELKSETKKGLFKRLGNALKKKKDIEVQKETILIKMKFNNSSYSGTFVEQLGQLGNEVNSYYKNAFVNAAKQQDEIKEKELELVASNKEVLINIEKIISSFKKPGINATTELHKQNSESTIIAAEQLKTIITYLLILLISVTVLLLLYSLLASNHEKLLASEKEKSDVHAKVKDHLLASMSHEIRTPLNSIIGFTQLLENTELEKQSKEMVESIAFSSNSLLTIVNNTLDFLKSEKGLMKIQKVEFNPFSEIQSTTSILKVLADNKNIDFIVTNNIPTNIQVKGDKNKLHQLIYNIVGNAIKFTNEGKVEIRASVYYRKSSKQQRLKLDISDTGKGIKNADLEKIFDEYYQTEDSNAAQSTGLGLAICKELVTLQGGAITAKSTVGKGSIFSFHIDYDDLTTEVVEALETNIVKSKEPDSNIQSLIKPNILEKNTCIFIVDDDHIQLAWIRKALQNKGYKCFAFNKAKAALASVPIYFPDFIFTDINMPEMGGIELLEAAKKINPNIYIIACTGDNDEELFLKYEQLGFHSSVTKPFAIKTIIDIIENPALQKK